MTQPRTIPLTYEMEIIDFNNKSPFELISDKEEFNEQYDKVIQLLSRLGFRRIIAIKLRFGLNGKKPHTFREIAQVLGVSNGRAHQIFCGTINRMRRQLATQD